MYYYKKFINGECVGIYAQESPTVKNENIIELTEEQYNEELEKIKIKNEELEEENKMPTYEELEEENARLLYELLTGEEM